LKGRYYWAKWSEDGFQQAISNFEQALGKDPGFALAYSGLADSFGVLAYFTMDPAKSHGLNLRSKAYAKRALELDEALPEAHLTLGNIAHFQDWDWVQAERELKLVLELNHNSADAHQSYSLFLMDQCLFEEAMKDMELALQLDPLSLPHNTAMGYLLFCTGRFEEAITRLRSTVELDPDLSIPHQILAASLERVGKNEKAVSEYLMIIPRLARSAEITESLSEAFANSGMSGFWRRFAELAPQLVEKRLITPFFAATIETALGNHDGAFDWLEKAFGERLALMTHLQAEPRFAPLRSDPRFGELLRRMGVRRVVHENSK